MKERGFHPNATTYNVMVSAHGRLENKKDYMRLYCEMIAQGFVPKTSTYNVLIGDFCRAGKMVQARELLKEMLTRGVAFSFDLRYVGVWLVQAIESARAGEDLKELVPGGGDRAIIRDEPERVRAQPKNFILYQ
ncbi:hypothetical protein MLD38_029474 [Melastoma candidum]|nr:hypothetical protein MLD38_029474 [Melastoma candidum]